MLVMARSNSHRMCQSFRLSCTDFDTKTSFRSSSYFWNGWNISVLRWIFIGLMTSTAVLCKKKNLLFLLIENRSHNDKKATVFLWKNSINAYKANERWFSKNSVLRMFCKFMFYSKCVYHVEIIFFDISNWFGYRKSIKIDHKFVCTVNWNVQKFNKQIQNAVIAVHDVKWFTLFFFYLFHFVVHVCPQNKMERQCRAFENLYIILKLIRWDHCEHASCNSCYQLPMNGCCV